MAIRGAHHLVTLVDDVPEAESYYRELFDADVLFREGTLDGEPGTVPDELSWAAARERGVAPTMAFLGRDEFNFAVAEVADGPTEGRIDHVALDVDEEAFEDVTERAEALGCRVERNAAHHRVFTDRYDLEWELNAKPRPPSRAFEPFDL